MDNDKKPVFIVDGQEVDGNGKPLAEAGKVESGVGEVDALRQELAAAQKERDEFKADMLTAQREKHEQNQAADRQLITQKNVRDQMEMNYQQAAARGGQEREELQEQIQKLSTEVSESHSDLEVMDRKLADALARAVLPTDARDRLIAVNGINAALADKALDALKTDPITEGQ